MTFPFTYELLSTQCDPRSFLFVLLTLYLCTHCLLLVFPTHQPPDLP